MLIFGFVHTHKISTVFACQISIAVLICGLVHTHTKLAQQPAQFFACTISTAVLTCEISTVVLDHNAHRALYKRIFQ